MNKKLVAVLLSTGILVSTCGTVFANEVVVDSPVETVNTPAPPINTTEAPPVNIEEPTEEVVEEEKPEEKQEVKDNSAEQMAQLVEQANKSLDVLQKIIKDLKEINGMKINNYENEKNAHVKFVELNENGVQEVENIKELLEKVKELNNDFDINLKAKMIKIITEFGDTRAETQKYIIDNSLNLHGIPSIFDTDKKEQSTEKPEENTPPVKDIINMTNALPKEETQVGTQEPIEFVNNDSVNVGNDVIKNTIGENIKEMVELPKAELPKVETPKAYEGMNKATSTVSESGSKMGSGTSTSYSSTGTENPKTGDYTTLGASIATMIAGIAGIFVSRKR